LADKQTKYIFVVDDEKIIAQTVAAIMRQAGFRADSFHSAAEAIDAASIEPPDLMITDVVMPGMSGIDLAILFEERWPRCKTLLFSGQAVTADLLETARKSGHQFDVLPKPVHPSDLLAKLRELR
jgi:DNA-binding NtrC family response regulator